MNALFKARPDLAPVECREYDSCFVFKALTDQQKSAENSDELFDVLYGVNKQTGIVAAFNPMDIPADEYKRGKKVTIPLVHSFELYHHGIKGMRWGVRRFQNKDGSLTPAGEKRRKKLEAGLEKLTGKKKSGDADNSEAKPARKTAKDMTDDELDKAIIRARKEDEYNRLRPEPTAPQKKSSVLVNDVLKPAMINSGKKFAETAMNKLVDKLLGDKVDPNSIEALKKTYEKLELNQKIDKIRNPDKYLSEEDKTKRQDREYKAEDRAAQKEGYANAADKAKKQSDEKKAADEAARVANEAKSREHYDSTYNNKGVGEKTDVNPSSSSSSISALLNSPVNSFSNSTVSTGKSRVDSYLDVLDREGNVLASFDQDGERK
jgi:hypothetical protein